MSFNVNNSLYSIPRTTEVPDWVRPSDWLPITDTDNQVQALVNDTGAGWFSFTTTFTAGAGVTCSVDWGDGTVSKSTTSPFRADKYYTPGTGATCSRGYTTFNVKISIEDNATPITSCRFTDVGLGGATASNGTYLTQAYSVGLLEMYYGRYTQQSTSMAGYFSANDPAAAGGQYCANFSQLEYVKMPPNMLSGGLNNCFEGCINLYKIDMPEYIAAASDSMASTFLNCHSLQAVDLPTGMSGSSVVWNITSLADTFNGCYNLKRVTLPKTLNSLTTMANGFAVCSAIVNIDMPATPLCTSYFNAFGSCSSLKSFRFLTLLTTGNTITFGSMFFGCRALESCIFPATWANAANITSMVASNMFGNCTNLIDIVMPVFTFGNMQNMFASCSLLQSVRFGTIYSTSSINLGSLFSTCQALQTVNLPTLSGTITSASSIFSNCNNISSVTIPFNCSTLDSAFNQCYSLVYANISACSSANTLANTFVACTELKTIIFPTSMNLLTTLNTTFSLCTALEEITMPNTLLVTNYNTAFGSCRTLRKITWGTVGSALTNINFNNMFNGCNNIQEIDLSFMTGYTLPSGSLSNNFINCYSVKKITLPNTQWTAFTNPPGAAFTNCTNLKDIINFDKLGSTSTTGTIINWVTNNVFGSLIGVTAQLTGLTFSCRNGAINISGTPTQKLNFQNMRLTNTGTGQWTGTSPQINISYTSIGYAALITLFNDIAAQGTVTTKTINITSCTGASSLTAADRLILTSRGWTITG